MYFRCPAQHGLFCRPWTIQAVESVETGTAELKSLTKHLEEPDGEVVSMPPHVPAAGFGIGFGVEDYSTGLRDVAR